MKKLLLYLVLAVVSSLSAFPQAASAQPYDCESCKYPFDIRNSLYVLMQQDGRLTPNSPYSFTGDISANNEAAWNNVVWTDVGSKPEWETLTNWMFHDFGYEWRAVRPFLDDVDKAAEMVEDVDGLILEMAEKLDAPTGTTSQYVRGDGSLATFPTTTPAHVHATADVTSGTFADGRIAQSNVTQHQAALSIGSSQVTGTKTSSFISDFTEAAQDGVLGVVTAGSGLSYTYNDAGNAASISIASKTYQAPTFNSATTATRLSTSVDATVFYSFDAVVTVSLLAGQSITAVLRYADDSGMSSNVVTLDSAKTANSGVLNLSQTNTLRVGGIIPAGKYRQVTFTTAGSGVSAPSAIAAGQEVF